MKVKGGREGEGEGDSDGEDEGKLTSRWWKWKWKWAEGEEREFRRRKGEVKVNVPWSGRWGEGVMKYMSKWNESEVIVRWRRDKAKVKQGEVTREGESEVW